MTYKETLDYLYKMLPMYQRDGAVAFKKDLTNIKKLMTALGNQYREYKMVHIAGTNGKGSVAHLIAGGLQSQGMQVGVYTSPHYRDFRERIKINGKYVSARYIVKFVEKNRETIEEVKPSFFEITVALAFQYFKDKKVDWAVIETGLGGRLDSTNIIIPELAVITNIGMDHMQMLGNSLPEIAREKAGIIKTKVPVIIGEYQKETMPVFLEVAKARNADLKMAEKLVRIEGNKVMDLRGNILLSDIYFDKYNPFFKRNLITSIAGLLVLIESGLNFSWVDYQKFWPHRDLNTNYIGRWHWLSMNPKILADSAHNKEGLNPVLQRLDSMNFTKIHFVLGFSNDKDINEMLSLFPKEGQYYFGKANVPRGLDAGILSEKARNYGLIGKAYTSIKKALSAAKKKQKSNELIFVGGSIFVVAEVI